MDVTVGAVLLIIVIGFAVERGIELIMELLARLPGRDSPWVSEPGHGHTGRLDREWPAAGLDCGRRASVDDALCQPSKIDSDVASAVSGLLSGVRGVRAAPVPAASASAAAPASALAGFVGGAIVLRLARRLRRLRRREAGDVAAAAQHHALRRARPGRSAPARRQDRAVATLRRGAERDVLRQRAVQGRAGEPSPAAAVAPSAVSIGIVSIGTGRCSGFRSRFARVPTAAAPPAAPATAPAPTRSLEIRGLIVGCGTAHQPLGDAGEQAHGWRSRMGREAEPVLGVPRHLRAVKSLITAIITSPPLPGEPSGLPGPSAGGTRELFGSALGLPDLLCGAQHEHEEEHCAQGAHDAGVSKDVLDAEIRHHRRARQ